MELIEISGHLPGLIGVAAVIASYRFKGEASIILMQTVGSLLLCFQFLLLGKMTGFALNGMCLLRNIAFCFNHKLGYFEKAVP